MALNPTRRGWHGQLVAYVNSLGVQAITGKPGKPTTQGKNERFHQTLFRWLDKQPLAGSIAELQAHVDTFDVIYNTERRHQGLPGRITPHQAWDATPVAQPPRPGDHSAPPDAPGDNTLTQTVGSQGSVNLHGIRFHISRQRAGQTIYAIWDHTGVMFVDTNGEIILEHPWPAEGQTYVSNGIRPGHPKGPNKPKPPGPSPMS